MAKFVLYIYKLKHKLFWCSWLPYDSLTSLWLYGQPMTDLLISARLPMNLWPVYGCSMILWPPTLRAGHGSLMTFFAVHGSLMNFRPVHECPIILIANWEIQHCFMALWSTLSPIDQFMTGLWLLEVWTFCLMTLWSVLECPITYWPVLDCLKTL